MLLADRYELTDRIGSGAMASVWAGRDTLLERRVAVKVVDLAAATDATFGERLRREAVATASLSHPDIVTVYDAGLDGRTAYVVMTLVEGRDLAQIVADRGPLPVTDATRVGARVAGALAAAHEAGIVHRDVKPANVLLHGPDDRDVTVVDFGIAAMTGAQTGLTAAGTVIGTAQYMSPEQASGQAATPASDVYALGCLLTTLLTGGPPFEAPSPVEVLRRHLHDDPEPLRRTRPEVPVAIETLVADMLAKEPARRPTAAQVQAALLAEVPPDVAATVPRVTTLAAGAGAGATGAAATVVQPPPTRVMPEQTGPGVAGPGHAVGRTPLPPSIPPRSARAGGTAATTVRAARTAPPRRGRSGLVTGLLALLVLVALALWAVELDRRSSGAGADDAAASAPVEQPAEQPEQAAGPPEPQPGDPADPQPEEPPAPPAGPASVEDVLTTIAVDDDVRADLTRRWGEVTDALAEGKPDKAARKARDLERRIDDLVRDERLSAADAEALRAAVGAATADLPQEGGPGRGDRDGPGDRDDRGDRDD